MSVFDDIEEINDNDAEREKFTERADLTQEVYVTAIRASVLLKITVESLFRDYVKTGKLTVTYSGQKKQAYFLRSAVEMVCNKWELKK